VLKNRVCNGEIDLYVYRDIIIYFISEYNPLSGSGGGSCSYRPSGRSGKLSRFHSHNSQLNDKQDYLTFAEDKKSLTKIKEELNPF